MKKKIIIVSFVFVVLVLLFVCLKFVSFGTKKSVMGASLISLEVPKFSSVESECCEYSATFKSVSSISVIKKELDDIMSNYYKMDCNGKTYYYDMSENVTITEYGVESGFLFNKFYINYSKGRVCNN